MAIVTMKSLLESGVHFGHRTHRWNPHMNPYIFTERNGIHIINLQLTVKALEEAYNVVRDSVAAGGTVLFVGTKRQAQETIEEEATRCGMPYVTVRWLGGMLTNYRTIRERINELERLERMRDSGEFSHLTKREALMLNRKIEKLEMRFSGTRHMIGLPDLLFVVDVRREETAVHEANLLDIPVIAMVDTNCDPRPIDYVIPSNDDAIRAIKLIVGKIADAALEGRALRKEEEEAAAEEVAAAGVADQPELADEELLGAATLAKLKDFEVDEPVTAEADAAKEVEKEAEADFEFDELDEAGESVEAEAGEGSEAEAAPVAETEQPAAEAGEEPAAASIEPAAEADEESEEPAAEASVESAAEASVEPAAEASEDLEEPAAEVEASEQGETA